MTTILLSLLLATVFITAIVSPHAAGKIKYQTDRKASRLKRMSNWLWDPLTWWTKKSIEVNRRIIGKFIKWGKRTRKK